MPKSQSYTHPLQIADYRAYVLARLCATLGQNSLTIVIAWQVYNIARETMSVKEATAQLGLIGLIQFLPLFLLTPITGWVADHFDRRRVGALSSLILTLCATTLALTIYKGWISQPIIFAVAFFIGIARAFNGPAMSALTARIVPPELLPRAIAISSLVWQTSAIAGPALGGLLYAIKPWAPFALAVALFAVSILSLSLIARFTMPLADKTRHPLRQMADGLIYVRSNKLVLGAITLDLVAVLLAGATALLPVYARDILHIGSSGLGQLAAAPGIGAVICGLWLGARPIERNVGIKMLVAVAGFGMASMVFGLTAFMPLPLAHWIALGALFCCGATDMVSVFIRQALIQLHTPDEMRGRVSSVSQLTISGANELGEAESGFVAALIGPVATVVVGGIGAILVTIVWSRIFPALGRASSLRLADKANK